MKILRFIILLQFAQGVMVAQEAKFENPDAVMQTLYQTLQLENDSARYATLQALFLESGQVNASLQLSGSQSNQKLGHWKTFTTQSAQFYAEHLVRYDEIERHIDYYQDLASINSLVFQTIVNKSNQTEQFEQMMWFSVQMVYTNNRWFISSASWVNGIDYEIEDALTPDTIWHDPRN